MTTQNPRDQWPAVPLAYEFVRPSYDWAMNRINAVVGRIQTLLVFVASFTVAGPALIASLADDIGFTSGWFIAGLGVFLVNAVIGTLAKTWGGITLLSIERLHEDWLHHSEWEFQIRAVDWAGRHFRQNMSVVNMKGRVATGMTALFLVEAVLFLVWVLVHTSRT